MKISYRILLINFAIVVLILSSSAFAFYSIMYEVLTSQQSKYLLNSANNLVYTLREVQQEWLDDLSYLRKESRLLPNSDSSTYNPQNIDFILIEQGTEGMLNSLLANQHLVKISAKKFTIEEFLHNNPLSIISTQKDNYGHRIYFGKIISVEFLNLLSKRINSELAVISGGVPLEISNELRNQKFLEILLQAADDLNGKENYRIFSESGSGEDVIATIYNTGTSGLLGNDIQFMIFNSVNETAGLRSSIQTILIIIGSAGVILSLILTFLFTDKFRKHITLLSKATKISKEGQFLNKINLKSRDELGQLAASFNEMIDELEKNQKTRNDYSEFLTLLNQNPSLAEISDAALKKIIKSCGFTAGALYVLYNNEISLTSSFGTKSGIKIKENNDLFYTVVSNKEPIELHYESDSPFISSGLVDISIKYLLIQPIIYNNRVIALLELAGIEKPKPGIKDYIDNIQDQLAIGLTNAGAFVQLENFVSELKLLNEEYQKQNMQIRKQNETLTELHEKLKEKADELEVQKEKAEESTKLKSQFLAGVSHELRTPMNSVLGLTELILNDLNLEKKNRERLEVVLKNGNRLMNLINEILDLSKIEAGKMEVQVDDLSLEEVITAAETAVSALAAQKNLKFTIKREINTDIILRSDKEKITQILINLLDNAVKFTEKGSVSLAVSLEDERVKFKVADTGIGISEKNLELIFKEFRQVDGSNSRKYGGTGLGLAICKKTAELLNGFITVESSPGKGSTFTFVLPAVLSTSVTSVFTGTVVIDHSIDNEKKKSVIVIEQNADIRLILRQYLASKNYDVVFIENEADIMETIKRVKPVAVLLDFSLNGKSSLDILQKIKIETETKDVPLLMLSVLKDENLGQAFAAFDYLIKPVSSLKIQQLILKYEVASKRKCEKILFVTDQLINLDDNQTFNIDVTDAVNAQRKIFSFRPDLVISDILTTGLDGFSILSMIKSIKEIRHIPVVLAVPDKFRSEEKVMLDSAVKDLTRKTKGHPLDMLKVIRDRIEINEGLFNTNIPENSDIMIAEEPEIETVEEELMGEIMIVDDDADTLFTLNEIVKSCNCKTILARSGKECLELLEHNSPDLILLDIMMPDIDGFQTLKKIRRKKKTEGIPVYAVTAKAMAEDKEIIIKHGFDDYISKPVNSGVIAFKIEKLFSKLKIA